MRNGEGGKLGARWEQWLECHPLRRAARTEDRVESERRRSTKFLTNGLVLSFAQTLPPTVVCFSSPILPASTFGQSSFVSANCRGRDLNLMTKRWAEKVRGADKENACPKVREASMPVPPLWC